MLWALTRTEDPGARQRLAAPAGGSSAGDARSVTRSPALAGPSDLGTRQRLAAPAGGSSDGDARSVTCGRPWAARTSAPSRYSAAGTSRLTRVRLAGDPDLRAVTACGPALGGGLIPTSVKSRRIPTAKKPCHEFHSSQSDECFELNSTGLPDKSRTPTRTCSRPSIAAPVAVSGCAPGRRSR